MWRIAWLGAKGVRWGAGPGSGPGTKLQQTERGNTDWAGAKGLKPPEKEHKLVRGQLGLAQGGKMTRTGRVRVKESALTPFLGNSTRFVDQAQSCSRRKRNRERQGGLVGAKGLQPGRTHSEQLGLGRAPQKQGWCGG